MFVVEMFAFTSSRLSLFIECSSFNVEMEMSNRELLDVFLDCYSKTSKILN